MTEQERINVEMQTKLALHDEKFDAFMREMQTERQSFRNEMQSFRNEMQSFKDEMRDFKQEMRDFKQEMREKDNQRHAEIAEIRQSVQSIQESGRNQTIVTFLGIAAMVVAVLLK